MCKWTVAFDSVTVDVIEVYIYNIKLKINCDFVFNFKIKRFGKIKWFGHNIQRTKPADVLEQMIKQKCS